MLSQLRSSLKANDCGTAVVYSRMFDTYPLAATDHAAGSLTYFTRDRIRIQPQGSIPLVELFPFIAERANQLNFFVLPSHDKARPLLALAVQTEHQEVLQSFHLVVLRIMRAEDVNADDELEAMILSMGPRQVDSLVVAYESPLEHIQRHLERAFWHLTTEYRHHQAWQTLLRSVQGASSRGFAQEALPDFVTDLLRLSHEVVAEKIDPSLHRFYRQLWNNPPQLLGKLSTLFASACAGRYLLLQPSDTEFIVLLIPPSQTAVQDVLYALMCIGEDHLHSPGRSVLQLQQLSLLQQRHRTIDRARRLLLSEFVELLLVAAL